MLRVNPRSRADTPAHEALNPRWLRHEPRWSSTTFGKKAASRAAIAYRAALT